MEREFRCSFMDTLFDIKKRKEKKNLGLLQNININYASICITHLLYKLL